MGQINTNNYPAVDSLLDADLLIVENAMHGTGTTTPKQLRENAIGTDPLQTTAQTVTSAINEIFEMATDTVVGLELGKMTSFSDGVIVTDIDLHRAPVAGDRILFYHNTAVASPSSLTTYNDGVAVTTTIGDFSLTHPAGLTLMKCVVLGESLRWQTVQDITSGYTAGVGISINGTTINNSAPQLGDDIAYSRIDTVTSGALGYFNADADCLVMDFRTDAEPYNGGYTLRLTTTGASFKYAVLKDKAGNNYAEEIPAGSLVMCKSNVSGTGSEADPVVVTVLEIGNTEMAHDVEVLKDICITEKTVSGNPVTVTDALPYAALSLSAEIEASQDLHGYDHPWAGGAYKNKLPLTLANLKAAGNQGTWNDNVYTHNGVTYTVNTDSGGNVISITINGTASGTAWLFLPFKLPAGTYTLGGCPIGGSMSNYVHTIRNVGGGVNISGISDDSGNGATFTLSEELSAYDNIRIASGYTANNLVFYPQIESGNAKTTFAPYSNICPISGRTETSVDDHGKNFLVLKLTDIKALNTQGTWVDNAYTYDNVTYTCYTENDFVTEIKVNASAATTAQRDFVIYRDFDNSCPYNGYVLNGCPSNGSSSTFDLRVSDITTRSSADWGSGVTINLSDTGKWQATITIRSGQTPSNVVYKPMIRPSGTSADFEPYKSSSVTIQLGQTVYGGTVDLVTGAARITHAIATYTASSGFAKFDDVAAGTRYVLYTPVSPLAKVTSNQYADIIANAYKGVADMPTNLGEIALRASASPQWLMVVSDKATIEAFNADLTANNLVICYPLATPIELTLTPTEMEMLKGYNQISSDGGGDITLTYRADRLAAIEAALAELQ